MPTLDFKGKQHIYAHHLTVPYGPIETDENFSCNPDTEYKRKVRTYARAIGIEGESSC